MGEDGKKERNRFAARLVWEIIRADGIEEAFEADLEDSGRKR